MKRLDEILVTALILSALGAAPSQSLAQGTMEPLTITFDGGSSGGYRYVSEYFESGVWFRSPGAEFALWAVGGGFGSTNVLSTYLSAPPSGALLLISFADGAAFNLLSVDLAEYSSSLGNPAIVGFVGYRQDGSIVTAEFTTDGIVGSPVPNFETFHFGPEFSGLSYVEIPRQPPFTIYSLDNVVILVPEPSAMCLILSAVGAFACFRQLAGPRSKKRDRGRNLTPPP